VLIVGMGGGNDIVMSVLLAEYLARRVEVDIAGVLNPAAWHNFGGKDERPINLNSGAIIRKIPSKKFPAKRLVDSYLLDLQREFELPISRIYELSLRFGTAALEKALAELIAMNGYDEVVGIDVGGDVLARGREDPTVLTPLMDNALLYVLGRLSIRTEILIIGLGADGELPPPTIRAVVGEMKKEKLLLATGAIDPADSAVKAFKEFFAEVAKIRRGNAIYNTLQSLDCRREARDFATDFSFRTHLNDKTWTTKFHLVIPAEYCGQVFLLDLPKLALRRRLTVFPFEYGLEQFAIMKARFGWKTEMDLGYWWTRQHHVLPNSYCLLFLTPALIFEEDIRREMITVGLAHIDELYDVALLLARDLPLVKAPAGLKIITAGCFALAIRKHSYAQFGSLIERLFLYQQ
jgi:hypothetical protein